MNQGSIISAYKSLKKLAAQELPIVYACRIHRLMVSLRPAYDFQVEEEEKLLRKMNPSVLGDGNLQFSTVEDAQEFKARMKEITDMEVDDIEVKPITIPIMTNANLTANDIDALDGFVEFVET